MRRTMSLDELSAFFRRLMIHGKARVGNFDAETIGSLGLPVRDGEAILDPKLELLDARMIEASVSPATRAWLQSLAVKPSTGSTNSDLMRLAPGGIDGSVVLAETQLGGRGRRGRTWISPFARNISLSMGLAIEREGHELGSLSLTVGLAVLKALYSLGVGELSLKWPNDVLCQGRKLCGVLIEVDRSRDLPQAVVGIGINHGGADLVRGRIDQELADLTEIEPTPGRNETIAAVISAVHDYTTRFNQQGFAPLAREWESRHRFHGKEVRVMGGSDDLVGRVLGVSNLGELRLWTGRGEQLVSGGELSMRALKPPIA